MIYQLNETQINNLLSSQVVGRLACTDHTQPYIVPVTYAYDGKYIFGQSNEGKKLEILRNNPLVCFEVDRMLNMTNWQSVIVFGIFEELTDEAAKLASDFFFDRLFPLTTSTSIFKDGRPPQSDAPIDLQKRQVFYRIIITKVTGRFEKE